MLLRDVVPWPPALTDSQTFKVAQSGSVPATLKRCGVFTTAGAADPYLSIVVDFQGRAWHAMIQDLPEPLLRRIEAALSERVGEPLSVLGDLQIN